MRAIACDPHVGNSVVLAVAVWGESGHGSHLQHLCMQMYSCDGAYQYSRQEGVALASLSDKSLATMGP